MDILCTDLLHLIFEQLSVPTLLQLILVSKFHHDFVKATSWIEPMAHPVTLSQLTYFTSNFKFAQYHLHHCQKTLTDSHLSKFSDLNQLNINYCQHITDEGLSYLTNVRELLLVSCPKVTSNGISKLHRTQYLYINSCPLITDTGLNNLTNLVTLFAKRCDKITSNSIKNLTNLTELRINKCSSVRLSDFKDLTKLATLDMNECNYEDTFDESNIGHFTNLQELQIEPDWYNNTISDDVLKFFKNIPTLGISYNIMITDNGIKQLTCVTNLNISGTHITGSFVPFLTNLKSLNLSYCSNLNLEYIAYLTHLQTLNISSTQINDQSLSCLSSGNLTNLIIDNCRILTEDSIKLFTRLKYLSVGHIASTLTNICLQSLTNLMGLNMYLNNQITDEGLTSLVQLTDLDMTWCPNITNNGLSKMTKLCYLNIMNCQQITDDGILPLVNLIDLALHDCTGITLEMRNLLRNLGVKIYDL